MDDCCDKTFESRGLEMLLRRKHPVTISLWLPFQRWRNTIVNVDDDGEAKPKGKKGKLISFETIPFMEHEVFTHTHTVCFISLARERVNGKHK